MKGKAIFSCYYLAPIAFYYYLTQYNNVSIDIYENFVKQTYRSRTYILGPNGIQSLTIPLKHVKKRQLVKDIQISYSENWMKNHWKSLEAAYRRSPYFEYYEDELIDFFNANNKPKYLIDLNFGLQDKLLKLIGLNSSINLSEKYLTSDNDSDDFRSVFCPKDNNNSLIFPEYTQVFGDRNPFAKNMSIVDLLFNEGPNTLNYLKSISK